MSEILIAILITATTAVMLGGLVWARRGRRPLAALIFGICLLYELGFVDMPMVYSLISGFKFEAQMVEVAKASELVEMLLGEFLYVATFTSMFVLFESTRERRTVASEVQITPESKRLLMILSCLGAVIAISTLVSPMQTLTEGSEHMLAKTYSGPGDVIFTWLQAGFWCSGLYAGGVLFVAPFSSRLGRLIGLAAVVPLGIFGMLSGVRGRVIWAVMSVMIAGVMFRAKTKVKMALCGLVIALPFFALMGNLDFRYLVAAQLGGKSLFEVIPLLTRAQSLMMGGSGAGGMAESLVGRAMGPRNSVILYRLYDRGEGCGSAAITSSIYLPIPRFIWAHKRPAGSCDATEVGGAMYQVMSYGYGTPPWVMGPYLASAHAYYEGGWVLVIVFGMVIGGIWSMISAFAERRPLGVAIVYIMVFLSAFTLDGFFTGIAPVHEFIRTLWLAFVPLLFLEKIVYMTVGQRMRPSNRYPSSISQAVGN